MTTYYTKTHEWVRFAENGTALVGVTAHRIREKKKPSCINVCDEGEFLKAGAVAGDVEFFKGVFDLHAPVTGVLSRVNEAVLFTPERLEEQPDTWIFELSCVERTKPLLTEAEYEAFVQRERE